MLYPGKYDPVWHLRESGFTPDYLRYYESIFALGNGYLGTRGSFEENVQSNSPATLIAGLYDRDPEDVTELANVANWLGIEISIDGEPINIAHSRVVEHERILDLQTGVLHRRSLFQLHSNRHLQIISRRFVSVADIHVMGIEYSLRVIDSRASAKMVLSCGFDGSVTNEGRKHFSVTDSGSLEDNGLFICQKALHSDHQIAMVSRLRLFKDQDMLSGGCKLTEGADSISAVFDVAIEPGIQYRLEKIVAIYSSRESSDPKAAMKAKYDELREPLFRTLLEEHAKVWAKRWENSDIEIGGDDLAQLALRFSIFHLLQASSEIDDRISIPAKALTGFGYKGHVFWDTDIFMLPYFNVSNPLLSRNMLTYRYHTLAEAKKRAKAKGYQGALFAWESADTGEETTPQFVKHLTENKIVRIWSGDTEQHISSDVAYAVWQYFMATRDTDFLLKHGAEIILETARFWVSRAEYNAKKKRYEIRKVIGPDEYHENIDNNYFTNAMAQWNIRKGIEIYSSLKKDHAADWERITGKISLKDKELAKWRTVAEKLFIHFDQKRKVFVQFDGFMALENVDLEKYEGRTQPMDVVLGPDRISKSKISKQADVLMMLSLFRESFSKEIKQANWDLYEPLCGHGSSLSPATHSLVASDLGLLDVAYRFFAQTAGIDLRDKMGNSGHGIHAATAGGLLQAAIFGFAGIRITEDGVVVNPRLPRHWKSMKFNLWYNGKRIRMCINC